MLSVRSNCFRYKLINPFCIHLMKYDLQKDVHTVYRVGVCVMGSKKKKSLRICTSEIGQITWHSCVVVVMITTSL